MSLWTFYNLITVFTFHVLHGVCINSASYTSRNLYKYCKVHFSKISRNVREFSQNFGNLCYSRDFGNLN